MCESPECAKLLIEHGASPSDINGEGITVFVHFSLKWPSAFVTL